MAGAEPQLPACTEIDVEPAEHKVMTAGLRLQMTSRRGRREIVGGHRYPGLESPARARGQVKDGFESVI